MEPGRVLGDRFRLVAPAGRGGMGQVWRALDLRDGGEVAIKTLLDRGASLARFEREASLLASVRDPALVAYVAHGETDGVPWLAMRWVEGGTLEQRLARAPLSVSDSVTLARRVARALAALHRAGVVHRDVKPSNVMLPGGSVEDAVLVDLGIARGGSSPKSLTRTNLVIGTLGYMAPEQARAGKNVDARADVFSLGCVLFECLTGEPVYGGDNPVAILARLLVDAPRRASDSRADLPEALDALVSEMLRHDRDGRPRDGAEVIARLDALGIVDAGLGAPAGRAAPALTRAEQRFALAAIVAFGSGLPDSDTISPDALADELAAIQAIARSLGAQAVPLGAAQAVVLVPDRGTVADRAAVAAAALRAVVTEVAGTRGAIAAGLSTISSPEQPAGDVLERAASLASAAETATVRLDTVAGELLAERFAIEAGVLGEARSASGARTVRGRVAPFVGREKDLGMLEATIAEAIEESAPRIAVLLAPPGSGKSRLARELVAKLRGRAGVRLVEARADATTAGSAHALVKGAVRAAAGLEPGAADHGPVRAYAEAIAAGPDRERLADFLGELAGAARTDEPGPELASARGDFELMARWKRRSVREWLAAESARQPLVLVLEDLHWADEASIAHLGEALRALSTAPLVVVGLARPEAEERLRTVWPDAAMARLAPLGLRAGERLVCALLGQDADADVVARIVERAGGNPLFLEELARMVADGREGELPATVLAVLDAKIAELDPDARRILRAASVLGERVRREAVAAVALAPLDEVSSTLDAIARGTDLLVPGIDDHDYAFRHALVRDAAYATLPEPEARAAHGRAADWLEGRGDAPARAMIHHLERARDHTRLVPWLTEAARQAFEAGADHDAFELAARAKALGVQGVDEGRIELLTAIRANVADEHEVSARSSAIARDRLPLSHRDWFLAAAAGAWAAAMRGRPDELQEITRGWMQADAHAIEGRLAYLGMYSILLPLGVFGQSAIARGFVARIAPPRRSDTAEAAWYELALAGHAMFDRGRVGEALSRSRRAIDAARRSGDVMGIAFAEQWHTIARHALASSERAIADASERLAAVRALGFEHATLFLAQIDLQVRAPTDPSALDELDAQTSAPHSLRAAFASLYLLDVLDRRGRVDELSAALERCRGPLSTPFARPAASLAGARIHLAVGRAEDALALLDQAERDARTSTWAWIAEGIAVARVRALRALGREDEARTALEAGLARLASSVEGADAATRAWLESEIAPARDLVAMARDAGLRR